MSRFILLPTLLIGGILPVIQVDASEILYFTNDIHRPMTLRVYSYLAHRWLDDLHFAPGEHGRPVSFNSDSLYYMLLRDDRGIEWPLGPYNITEVRERTGEFLEIRLSGITVKTMCSRETSPCHSGNGADDLEEEFVDIECGIRWYRWRSPPEHYRVVPSPH